MKLITVTKNKKSIFKMGSRSVALRRAAAAAAVATVAAAANPNASAAAAAGASAAASAAAFTRLIIIAATAGAADAIADACATEHSLNDSVRAQPVVANGSREVLLTPGIPHSACIILPVNLDYIIHCGLSLGTASLIWVTSVFPRYVCVMCVCVCCVCGVCVCVCVW